MCLLLPFSFFVKAKRKLGEGIRPTERMGSRSRAQILLVLVTNTSYLPPRHLFPKFHGSK